MEKAVFLTVLCACIIYLPEIIDAQLRPGGKNVCSKTVSYNGYEPRRLTRVGYRSYRKCCKRFLGICTSRCTRYRTYTVPYYQNYLIVRYRQDHYCCQGWARSGSECPLPICNPGCDKGICIRPNVCKCKSGFIGNRCQTDRNECTSSPCQQQCVNLPGTYACTCKIGFRKFVSTPQDPRCKDVNECSTRPCTCSLKTPSCRATCNNNIGSFSCSCSFGFKLLGGKVCEDINECSSSTSNQCQQICLNKPGEYTCACRAGYELDLDGHSCKDIDECATLNGGCNQLCRNMIGSYNCACRRGFRLTSNEKTCLDINECSEKRPCDNNNGVCTNSFGSYKCSCKSGFYLLPDKTTCRDINECSSKKNNGCQQKCHNAIGSYTCSCEVGYRLDVGQRKCNDIDECREKLDNCQQNCHNAIGSFTCSCKPGYQLEKDGFSCRALPCKTITAPINGKLSCDGYVTDKSCNFTCNDGFNLIGSSNRTCQSSGTWSNGDTTCSAKMCPSFNGPTHGAVIMPCLERFGSTCLTKCSKGYYMKGSSLNSCVVENGKTSWSPNNASCIAFTPCVPNPCQHRGKCIKEKTSFICDCKKTGYAGKKCDEGIIKILAYSYLTVNQSSMEIIVTAKPDDYISIHPFTANPNDVTFAPEDLYIYSPSTQASFTITPKRLGQLLVQYKIFGKNAKSFRELQPSKVFVTPPQVPGKVVKITKNFLHESCQIVNPITACKRYKAIYFKSTCSWFRGTHGFVTVAGSHADFPLSFVGLHEGTFNNLYKQRWADPKTEMLKFLKSRSIKESCNTCNGIEQNENNMDYLVDNNYFQIIFLQTLSKYMPLWLDIKPGVGQFISVENLKSTFGLGSKIKELPSCVGLPLLARNAYIVYQPTMPLIFQISTIYKQLGQTGKEYCIAVDLCRKVVHVNLPNSASLDFTDNLADVSLQNIRLTVKGFSILKPEKCLEFNLIPMSRNNCVKSGITLRMKGGITTVSAKLRMIGNFYIEHGNFDKIIVTKFDDQIRYAFQGNLTYEMNFPLLNSNLILSGVTTGGEIFGDVGGTESCPLCKNKGLFAYVKGTSSSFKYEDATFRFLPDDEKFLIYLPYNVNGGLVMGISNKRQVNLQLRLLTVTLPSMVAGIKSQIASLLPKDEDILNYYFSSLNKKLKDLHGLLKKRNVIYQNAVSELKVLKDSVVDLKAALNSLQKRIPQGKPVKRYVKNLLLRISQIENIKLKVLTSNINTVDQGSRLSYFGKFCVHKLCLKKADITIFNYISSNCHKCNHRFLKSRKLYIQVKLRSNEQISSTLAMQRNDEMILEIDQNSNNFSGTLKASVKLFGNNYDLKFQIDNSAVKYEIKNVSVGSLDSFSITGMVSIEKATWKNLFASMHGSSYKTSGMTSITEKYLESIATKTFSRMEKLKVHADKLSYKLLKEKKDEEIIRNNLHVSSRSFRLAQKVLSQIQLELHKNQTLIGSYLTNHPELNQFIEKNVEKVCRWKKCQNVCIMMPQCDICQDTIQQNINTLKCKQRKQEIKTSRLVSFESSCSLTRYAFIPVYTGTCPPDPAVQAQQRQQLETSLVAVGTSVGAMIAGPLGAVVGGIIGLIGGLFSSCDKSYEVVTRRYVVQEPCTLTKMEIKTIKRPVSDCFYVTKSVQTGFSVPRECNCKINECAAKITKPSCVTFNLNCEKKRKLFLSSSIHIPKFYTDLFSSIQELQNKLELAQIEAEKQRVDKLFYEHKINITSYQLANLMQRSKFANETLLNIKDILRTDLCLSNQYKNNKRLQDVLKIKEMNFDVGSPKDAIVELRLKVINIKSNAALIIQSIFDLNNERLSVESIGRKILVESLCKKINVRKSRKRRDVGVIKPGRVLDLPFTSWNADINANASAVQKSCLTLRNTLDFLSQTVKSIQAIIEERKSIPSQRLTIIPKSSFSNNVVSLAQKELLNSIEIRVESFFQKRFSFSILEEIEKKMDITTGSFNTCFNFKDCTELAFDTLVNLATIISSPKDSFTRLINTSGILLEETLSSDLSDFKHLQSKTDELSGIISQINTSSLHCADKPFIKPTPDSVKVLAGDYVSLHCDVISALPIRFKWMKQSKILDGETSSLLTFKSSLEEDSAVYSCVVSSMTGEAVSNGILLRVYTIPEIITKPKNNNYFLPPIGGIEPIFLCNASGFPKPTIEWYFKSFRDKEYEILKGENEPLLIVKSSDKKHAGHYYCRAKNEYGKDESEKVRLDILKTVPARQNLVITVSARSMASNIIFSNLVKEIRSTSNLEVGLRYNTLSGKISLNISSDPELTKSEGNYEELLDQTSKSRQDIANAAAVFVTKVFLNQTLISDDGSVLKVDNNSVSYQYKFNICSSGYQLQDNGFLCAQCPIGTYGPLCRPCPRGEFQPHSGMAFCIKCANGEITKDTSSTKKTDCYKRATDIVFVVDSSYNFIRHKKRKAIDFLQHIYSVYKNTSDVKFGLIAYNSWIHILHRLTDQRDQFPVSLKKIGRARNWRYLSHALNAAKAMLATSHSSTKIVIAITGGLLHGSYHDSGSYLARKVSTLMQAMNVSVIAIGMSNNNNIRELRVIASYPKKEYALIASNNTVLIRKCKMVLDKLINKDKVCLGDSIDVSILYEHVMYYNVLKYIKHRKQVFQLLSAIHEDNPGKYNFQFPTRQSRGDFVLYSKSIFQSELRKQDGYSLNRPMDYHRHDLLWRIQSAIRDDLTEDYNSLSKIKVLLVITLNPIPRQVIEKIVPFYKEKIIIVNFAISYTDDMNKDKFIMNKTLEVYRYGFYQVYKFIRLLNEKRKRISVC
ncbi:uncharacterized protein LOC130647080 [Hydractinia symbiolongicarpus]|uniref:uncharacterized protein LOC130647080 n=1 Tax=Hydractinia symbiolongicarpus TaxID=13093 RepID=UPI002550099B|nr:uncharacterized protein LOC130647080 [Hydractinia symbiolongicarpus]